MSRCLQSHRRAVGSICWFPSGGPTNKCRCELHVLLPPVLAYSSAHFVDEMDYCEVIGQIAGSEFIVEVVDLVFGPVSAAVDGDIFSNDAFRRTADQYELQVKYDRLVEQLNIITLECDIRRWLAREQGGDVINLRAAFDTAKEEYELLESRVAAFQKEKNLLRSSGTDVMRKQVAFRSFFIAIAAGVFMFQNRLMTKGYACTRVVLRL